MLEPKTLAALQACIDHARSLLVSARAVIASGHPNIAYHLAVLALEELGRRELILVQRVAQSRESASGLDRHLESHTRKLFWCFFGASAFSEGVSQKNLESLRDFSSHLHEKRLAGLYVDHTASDLNIPSEAIAPEECDRLVELAESRLALASAEIPRETIPEEEVQLQTWFLDTVESSEHRPFVFSKASIAKLNELKNANAWGRWLKEEIERREAENLALTREELERSRTEGGTGKRKWKVRVRLLSGSHTVRPKALAYWNDRVDWIKLLPVSGKKNQLLVEIYLQDHVRVEALWFLSWGIARHFAVALNIGTMGFWWWRMAEQVDVFYESMEDLERKLGLKLTRNPSLKVDWGANRALSEEDIRLTLSTFAALPGPDDRKTHGPLNSYIGGLTFLSLIDVHWECEGTIYGNFLQSLQLMMRETGDYTEGTPFAPVFRSFLEKTWPDLEPNELADILRACEEVEASKPGGPKVSLKHAAFSKLFCDAYFLQHLRPALLDRRGARPDPEHISIVGGGDSRAGG